MSNFAGSMPVGRTNFEHFIFEHTGLFIDLSQDGLTSPVALAVLLVPLAGLVKTIIFS